MKILAIETCTEACSAALLAGDQIEVEFKMAPREHSTLILRMVETLLAKAEMDVAQLDALAFGCGPGSFTGVRIGTGVAQGLAFGLDLPIVPVSTLRALAQGAWRDSGAEYVAAAIDARMKEVYWGCFRMIDGIAQPVSEEQVCVPEATIVSVGKNWTGIGSGWDSYPETLASRFEDKVEIVTARYPSAEDIAVLGSHAFSEGNCLDAASALPVYLRNQVATPKRTA